MIRYYPSSKIKANQKAVLGQFTLDGQPYSGSYYSTYDGKYFSGPNPIFGSNKELKPASSYDSVSYSTISNIPNVVIDKSIEKSKLSKNQFRSQPISYFPVPIESDYSKGYLNRYFAKKANERGYVIEISEQEFESIRNGTATYDVSFYQTTSILWKLTGPLNNKRVSQYDTRAGIIDTNKRLVETTNKTFVGIKEFIGEDYAKFARPTE